MLHNALIMFFITVDIVYLVHFSFLIMSGFNSIASKAVVISTEPLSCTSERNACNDLWIIFSNILVLIWMLILLWCCLLLHIINSATITITKHVSLITLSILFFHAAVNYSLTLLVVVKSLAPGTLAEPGGPASPVGWDPTSKRFPRAKTCKKFPSRIFDRVHFVAQVSRVIFTTAKAEKKNREARMIMDSN